MLIEVLTKYSEKGTVKEKILGNSKYCVLVNNKNLESFVMVKYDAVKYITVEIKNLLKNNAAELIEKNNEWIILYKNKKLIVSKKLIKEINREEI